MGCSTDPGLSYEVPKAGEKQPPQESTKSQCFRAGGSSEAETRVEGEEWVGRASAVEGERLRGAWGILGTGKDTKGKAERERE